MKNIYLFIILFIFSASTNASHLTKDTIDAFVNSKIRRFPKVIEGIRDDAYLDEKTKTDNIVHTFHQLVSFVTPLIRHYNFQEISDTIYVFLQNNHTIDPNIIYNDTLMSLIESKGFHQNIEVGYQGTAAYIIQETITHSLRNFSDNPDQGKRAIRYIQNNPFHIDILDTWETIIPSDSFFPRLFRYTSMTERDINNPTENAVKVFGHSLKDLKPEDYIKDDIEVATCVPFTYMVNKMKENKSVAESISLETLRALFYCAPFMIKYDASMHLAIGWLYGGGLDRLEPQLSMQYAPHYVAYFQEDYLSEPQSCLSYVLSLSWTLGQISNHHLNFLNQIMETHDFQQMNIPQRMKADIALAFVEILSNIAEGDLTFSDDNYTKLKSLIQKNTQHLITKPPQQPQGRGRGTHQKQPKLTIRETIQQKFIQKKKQNISDIEEKLTGISGNLKRQRSALKAFVNETEEEEVETLINQSSELAQTLMEYIEFAGTIPVEPNADHTRQVREIHDNIQNVYNELVETQQALEIKLKNSYRIQLQNNAETTVDQITVIGTKPSNKRLKKGPRQKRNNPQKKSGKSNIEQISTIEQKREPRATILSWGTDGTAQQIFETKEWIQPYPKKSYLVLEAINQCETLPELAAALGSGGHLEKIGEGYYSCRLNDQYRVTFFYNAEKRGFEEVSVVDYH